MDEDPTPNNWLRMLGFQTPEDAKKHQELHAMEHEAFSVAVFNFIHDMSKEELEIFSTLLNSIQNHGPELAAYYNGLIIHRLWDAYTMPEREKKLLEGTE